MYQSKDRRNTVRDVHNDKRVGITYAQLLVSYNSKHDVKTIQRSKQQ